MASLETRPITRPRISLSCVVCRRRKVRCGREQPACSNCVRINEACEYEADVRDRSRSQAKPSSTSSALREETSTSRQGSAPSEDAWAKWTERNTSAGYSHQTRFEEASVDKREPFKPSTLPQDASTSTSTSASASASVPASTSTYSPNESSPHGECIVSSQNLRPSRGISLEFSARDPNQSSSAVLPHTNHLPGSGAIRKRPWTEVDPTPQREYSANDVWTQDPSQPFSSTAKETPATEETAMLTMGYLSVRRGGRVRHVGDAFWGLIKGHVSSAILSALA